MNEQPGTATTAMLLQLQELYFQPGWRAHAHRHLQQEETLIILAGHLRLTTDAQQYDGGPGTIFTYPRTLAHTESVIGDEPVRVYCLSWQAPAGMPTPAITRQDTYGNLRTTAHWMLRLLSQHTTESLHAVAGLFQAMSYELLAPHTKMDDVRLEQVKDYLRAHLAESVSLQELADIAEISLHHLAHLFKAQVGCSPLRFLTKIRMETAQWLIESTTLPMKAIARQVGYADEFQFSRAFHRTAGYPPTTLRRVPTPRDIVLVKDLENARGV